MNEHEQLVSAKFMAGVLGVTVRRIQQLTQDGTIATVDCSGRRKYNLAKTVQAYVEYWKNKAGHQEKSESDAQLESEKLAAEARIKRAKADLAELELAEISGKMHSADDVEAIMTDNILRIRSLLLAMPGRVAMDAANAQTPATVADIIKNEVYSILTNMASYEYDADEYQRRVRERHGWDETRILPEGVEADE